MTQLTLFMQDDNESKSIIDKTCEKWGFDVRRIEHNEKTFYSINDWIFGVTGSTTRSTWGNMKAMFISNEHFNLVTRQYEKGQKPSDFTDKNGLFRVTQELRSMKDRPVLYEIKQFLANSGEFSDLLIMEKEKEERESKNLTHEKAKAKYIQLGKSEKWAEARVKTTVKRNVFTATIMEHVINPEFWLLTDTEYLGLFDRTAKQLEKQNGGVKPRNAMTEHALSALFLAESTIATYIGQRDEIDMSEAIEIIKMVCDAVKPTVISITKILGIDIATGKPLLNAKN